MLTRFCVLLLYSRPSPPAYVNQPKTRITNSGFQLTTTYITLNIMVRWLGERIITFAGGNAWQLGKSGGLMCVASPVWTAWDLVEAYLHQYGLRLYKHLRTLIRSPYKEKYLPECKKKRKVRKNTGWLITDSCDDCIPASKSTRFGFDSRSPHRLPWLYWGRGVTSIPSISTYSTNSPPKTRPFNKFKALGTNESYITTSIV